MSRGTLVAFSNPVSNERESEFNNWYNNIHAVEVVSLPGFSGMTRLRAGPSVKGTFPHRYLALFECNDIEQALASLQSHIGQMNISDAVDGSAVGVFFEAIFSLRQCDLPFGNKS